MKCTECDNRVIVAGRCLECIKELDDYDEHGNPVRFLCPACGDDPGSCTECEDRYPDMICSYWHNGAGNPCDSYCSYCNGNEFVTSWQLLRIKYDMYYSYIYITPQENEDTTS